MIEFISRLPQGYQEVEYIESSGTQFIDTGFVPNDNTEIILVFTNNNAATGNYDCMFGTRTNASNANTFALWLDINRRFGAFYGTGQNMMLFPTSINATAKHTATMKGRVAEIDGISVTCSATSSSPAYSFYIGACNTAGTADYFSKILIYESKIYDNVTLVRDFVPCYRKADNVAGLYDLVNNVFYTNAGSGVFAVGANSNKHAIATITPGGVISFSAALRRRMMMARGKKGPWIVTLNGNHYTNEPCSIGNPVKYNGKNYTVYGYNNSFFEVNDGDVIAVGYFNGYRTINYNYGYVAVDGQRVTNSTEKQCGYYYYTVRSDVVVTGFYNNKGDDTSYWYMGANIKTQ